jgi:hypothetical protein
MDIEKIDRNMAVARVEGDMLWTDARALTIEGKGWSETEEFYDRLPRKAKEIVRAPVWDLAKHAAGIAVRFVTDAPGLAVRWDGCQAMWHMPSTGVSGLDLYVRHKGSWRWLAVGKPSGPENETQLFSGLPVEEREFILYLPLYNPVHSVVLGVPAPYAVHPAPARPGKPIVFYGTSITQGGCASRPGMSYAAILGRRFDRQTINLGFSGNGRQEPEVIEILCELDPAVYVLDNLPNMTFDLVDAHTERAVRRLRETHSPTPIMLIENIVYCDAFLNSARGDRMRLANDALRRIYRKLSGEGMKFLFYVEADNLIGADGEATVDGTHFTDLGYVRFADAIEEPLRNALDCSTRSH